MTLEVFASNTLRGVLPQIARRFEAAGGPAVKVKFGPTGCLKSAIEGNFPCDVFLSGDEAAPRALVKSLMAVDAFRYAANGLAVVTRAERRFRDESWLGVLLDPSAVIGISQPRTSAMGDHAMALFVLIAKRHPREIGAKIIAQHAVAMIEAGKSPKLPEGVSPAKWMLENGADAALVPASCAAAAESSGLSVKAVPADEAPDMTLWGCFPRTGKSPIAEAKAFADFLRSPESQAALARSGFLPA